MAVYGVVAEYDPFHNGHLYHLQRVRESGDCEAVAVVLGGNFLQRGRAAAFPKRERARMALQNGADLIVELPLPYAAASAERFAQAAVHLLRALGLVDKLSFGSECGDIRLLQAAADALLSPRTDELIGDGLRGGKSYPAAREAAVRRCFGGEVAGVLKAPNDILAVEYCKALRALNAGMEPTAVRRAGASHGEKTASGRLESASALRAKLAAGEDISPFVPENVSVLISELLAQGRAPSSMEKLETAVLASLRLKTAGDFQGLAHISEGLENRLLAAVKTASSLEELYGAAKTKRYTHSRIRRAVLAAFLGIRESDVLTDPPYLRILGFNASGERLLRTAKSKSALPLVLRASDVKKLGPAARRVYALENRSTDIFNLSLPHIRPCGTDMTDRPVKI